MPIAVIAVLVIAVLGVGAYFMTSESEPIVNESEVTDIARTETDSSSEDGVQDAEVSGGTDEEDEMMEGSQGDAMMSSSMPDNETAAATPYLSEKTYLTPARTSHEIDVTLTLASDGTIVGANVSYDNGDGYSNPHQQRFDQAYQAAIIGQNIADAELSVTGGASLTTEAFNEAIVDIRTQAS